MKWYMDRIPELEKAVPIISVCGDDCAVCPRYLAQTEEELHETAIFWNKAGWRDRRVLELSELPDGYDFDHAFAALFAWCQAAFTRIERVKPR